MKILLYSGAFFPSMGGIETASAQFAISWHESGHDVTLVTATPSHEDDTAPYTILRCPSRREFLSLVKQVDIVFSNGASLVPVPFCLLTATPFVWTHQGYQIVSIDGLGWDGERLAPMAPFSSTWHWSKKKGLLYGFREGIKLLLRNFVARTFAYNIACSPWVFERLRLKSPDQIIINKHNCQQFEKTRKIKTEKCYDFVYLGRLSSEKGVDNLIKALALLQKRLEDTSLSLLIVGSGDMQERLETLANSLGVESSVHFVGKAFGDSLNEWLAQAKIGVMPSLWEEAYGLVTLEMFTAGLPVIHSARSGAASFVEEPYFTFENSDVEALSNKMQEVLQDYTNDFERLLATVDRIVQRVSHIDSGESYLIYFNHILQRTKPIPTLEWKDW